MENFRVFVHHDNTISARVLLNGLKIQLMKEYEAHYFIISYRTVICFVDFKNKTYCINPQKYSRTTSRQVNLIYRAAEVWESKGFERILWI
jgi:hypothetical protein